MTRVRQLAWAMVLAVAGVGTGAGGFAAAPAALRLGVDGTRLTVDGQARFLTLVSYFDAMDAVALDADLALLARSADGVRIFANWWELGNAECRYRFSDRTLFERRADGSIGVRPERLTRLTHVLTRAGQHDLIVDLTFAADPVAGASRLEAEPDGRLCPQGDFENRVDWPGVAAALGQTTRALAAPAYAHVFFDLQNEAGHDYNRASTDDLRLLADAVRRADPARLISVSMSEPDAERQAALVGQLGLSMLNFHDVPRGEGWGERTAGHVARYRAALDRAGLRVPIYAGEPDPGDYGGHLQEYRRALTGARDEGAAAWTFHTRAAFDLRDASLDQRLDPLTRRVLDAMRSW